VGVPLDLEQQLHVVPAAVNDDGARGVHAVRFGAVGVVPDLAADRSRGDADARRARANCPAPGLHAHPADILGEGCDDDLHGVSVVRQPPQVERDDDREQRLLGQVHRAIWGDRQQRPHAIDLSRDEVGDVDVRLPEHGRLVQSVQAQLHLHDGGPIVRGVQRAVDAAGATWRLRLVVLCSDHVLVYELLNGLRAIARTKRWFFLDCCSRGTS